VRSLPLTVTLSGELATPGLVNAAVIALPPSWPHARDVSTTARVAAACPAALFGNELPGLNAVPSIVACARRW
jgi:hypothetical protein